MDRRYYRENGPREYEAEKVKRRNPVAIVIMILALFGIAGGGIFIYVRRNTTYSSYEAQKVNNAITDARYIKSITGYAEYNCDGANGYNTSAEIKWKVSYDIKNPIAASCGDYYVFADRGGRTACVTDGTGANYVINVPEEIVMVCIAGQGVTAYLTDSKESDHIYIYNLTGEMLLDMETAVRTSGFPVTMALSEDGRKLVTSYYKIGEEQESWLTFYNFGEVGQNYADKIVGSFSYVNKLIPMIRFISKDRVGVFYEDGCTLYKLKEIPEELKKVECPGGVACAETGTACFAIAESKGDGTEDITLYDENGTKKGEIVTAYDYNNMIISEDELILTSSDSCVIYRDNGEEKYRGRMRDKINMMFKSSSLDRYIVVGEKQTDIIRLKTAKETEEELKTQ